ncbi:MAG TPA: glutamate-cysteine ligase family protein [Polyangiaceae bacterium]|nr:glutamate-cysteine ligase family protein [Polyangiaceae bacterium]
MDSSDDQRLLGTTDDLLELFMAAEKPAAEFRIGTEAEKFAVDSQSGAPLEYDGPRGVTRIFADFVKRGWQEERETPDGPVISLHRDQHSITLEPGSQFELSGAAVKTIHETRAELDEHLTELGPISKEMNLTWLGVGFHPLAKQSELGWVPKQRYAIMREYLPTRGSGGLDMMRRTATVQANFDFSSEADALKKLVVCLKLAPLVNALGANSPFEVGKLSGYKSRRGFTWLNMDPDRSGLLPALLRAEKPGYRDYADWALDAGMFLFKRHGRAVHNTGQKFRDFMQNGFEGERATFGDWKLHLNTLFPEARLKSTLEVRSSDSLPLRLGAALPALFTGILYDEQALSEADAFVREIRLEALIAARPSLVQLGLAARVGDRPKQALAERVLEIAAGGLARRAFLNEHGKDERIHLELLTSLVQSGKTPADAMIESLTKDSTPSVADIIARTHI